MIEQKVDFDRADCDVKGGVVMIRFELKLVNGEAILNRTLHRTALEIDTDIDAQLNEVSNHLEMMGWPRVPASEAEEVRAYVEFVRSRVK